jgi:hypothetical protein
MVTEFMTESFNFGIPGIVGKEKTEFEKEKITKSMFV